MIGRYVEADPIGIKEGQNHLFIYARNKPVSLADPKGLDVYPPPGDEDDVIIDWPEIIDSPCKRRCYTIAQLHHLCKLIPAAGYACTPVGFLFARACIQSFCECNDLTMPGDFTGS